MTEPEHGRPDASLRNEDFCWDAFDAYLFDIDGTLLVCSDAVHYYAFLSALRTICGRDITLDGVPVHGSTDPRILADALTRAGVREEEWRPVIGDALDVMCDQVLRNRAQLRAEVLPGVRELLAHLRSRGAVLGVATGNLEAIGWAKLESCGLREFFTFGGFSDRCDARAETFRLARKMAMERAGEQARLCVIGDTPADILAARENGLPVIAVATGIYTRAELGSLRPDACLGSLAELRSGEARS